MKKSVTIGITILLLWALAPGAGEVVENALHFFQEGHFTHASPDGDRHAPAGPEHGCTSSLHLCSCCISFAFLPAQGPVQIPNLMPEQSIALPSAALPSILAGSIYHPPRA